MLMNYRFPSTETLDYRACPNLVRLFFDQAGRLGAKPFLWKKSGGRWVSLAWAEAASQVRRLAESLHRLGVSAGDRVVILADNGPKWVLADLAIMAAGGITVPAYSTGTIDDWRHIIGNVNARGILVSGRLVEQALVATREAGCEFLICLEDSPLASVDDVSVLSWAEAIASDTDDEFANRLAARLGRTDLACIMHTSGTGGAPKGAMISHGAILSNCHGAYELLLPLGLQDEVFLSFLPLSHAYEHTAGLYFPISIGAQIYFAEGAEHLPANLVEVQPTIMTAVPRLYETIRRRVLINVERQGKLAAALLALAVRLGERRYRSRGHLRRWESAIDGALDALVRSKFQARFGGRLKALISGGAALNPEVGMFFTALGVPILQGYGQTEAGPIISCNPPGGARLETVGPPLMNVEMKIADDGEILVRGEAVMSGYWNDPAASKSAIIDGWLHTGDIGLLDEKAYLTITDRKRDFIKTSGGEIISPARVEGALAFEREIAQAMVYGEKRPYMVAIVVPNTDFISSWAKAQAKSSDYNGLATDPELRRVVDAAVRRVNRRLAPPERIRHFVLAREPFSTTNGQMTPTLKVKRHRVSMVYGPELDALYDAG
jgi:long-chain acyl-CoA synthetase